MSAELNTRDTKGGLEELPSMSSSLSSGRDPAPPVPSPATDTAAPPPEDSSALFIHTSGGVASGEVGAPGAFGGVRSKVTTGGTAAVTGTPSLPAASAKAMLKPTCPSSSSDRMV